MQTNDWQKIKEVFNATLDLPEAERASFLENYDENIRLEVKRLIKSDEEAKDFIIEPAFLEAGFKEEDETDLYIGKQIDSYQILEEIGQGGMGTVYLAARNDDFEKRVALKLIKRGMDTNSVLKRFRLERQILAQLEHPFIANLLDGGSTSDGLPYLVMEYIEGERITKFCDSHRFSIEERLELFRKVCSAVSFAHKNLVVHRDIKPSNILVTADGTPKLLDFGIAKLLHPDRSAETDEATATMFRIMTPEYASPEQIQGLPINTSSDVYSLGLVLRELLKGKRPFTMGKDTEENKSQTQDENNQESNFKEQKLLEHDLENIVNKSLREETERRYQSVQEFSEDIRRHLTGLPVTATTDTTFYRVGKFVKRHRVGVFAGGVVCLSLLAGVSTTAWQANRANIERAKAEQRFQDVRKLANSVVFELHDSIENLPGSTPSRELLVSRALEYLDKLASEPESDNQLKMELADAYDKIGDIQGGLATSQLGKHEKAFESYRKSLRIRENMIASEPNNRDFQSKLATSYSKIGDLLWVEVKIKESEEMYQKSFQLYSQLASESPTDKEIHYKLAICQQYLARVLAINGNTQESLTNAKQAVVILENLAESNPNDEKINQGLTLAYDRAAEVEQNLTQNYDEALLLHRKSQAVSEKLLAVNPQNTKLRRGVAVSFFNIAGILEILGKNQEALENSQKSLAIFNKLTDEDPKNEEFKEIVAAIETQVCGLLTKNGKPDEAIKRLENPLNMLKKQIAESSQNEILNFRIAIIYENLGNAYFVLGSNRKNINNLENAKSFLQKSLEIYKGFKGAGKLVGEDAKRLINVEQILTKCTETIKLFIKE